MSYRWQQAAAAFGASGATTPVEPPIIVSGLTPPVVTALNMPSWPVLERPNWVVKTVWVSPEGGGSGSSSSDPANPQAAYSQWTASGSPDGWEFAYLPGIYRWYVASNFGALGSMGLNANESYHLETIGGQLTAVDNPVVYNGPIPSRTRIIRSPFEGTHARVLHWTPPEFLDQGIAVFDGGDVPTNYARDSGGWKRRYSDSVPNLFSVGHNATVAHMRFTRSTGVGLSIGTNGYVHACIGDWCNSHPIFPARDADRPEDDTFSTGLRVKYWLGHHNIDREKNGETADGAALSFARDARMEQGVMLWNGDDGAELYHSIDSEFRDCIVGYPGFDWTGHAYEADLVQLLADPGTFTRYDQVLFQRDDTIHYGNGNGFKLGHDSSSGNKASNVLVFAAPRFGITNNGGVNCTVDGASVLTIGQPMQQAFVMNRSGGVLRNVASDSGSANLSGNPTQSNVHLGVSTSYFKSVTPGTPGFGEPKSATDPGWRPPAGEVVVPPTPGSVVSEFDVIMGNVPNPYPTSGYSGSRAFVSAEGFGYKAWTQYRDGGAKVKFVTTLSGGTGEGTLRDAFEGSSGGRKIWPLVWGYVDSPQAITPTSGAYYTNVFRPAGKGLVLRNGVTTIDSGAAGGIIVDEGVTDIVLRFLKSHAGAQPVQVAGLLGSDGIRWSTSGMNNVTMRNTSERIIIDHSNFAFAADQSVGSVGVRSHTLQHTWIQKVVDTHFHRKYFESGINHAMPIIYGYETGNVSMHHVLMETGRERLPRVSDMLPGAVFDGRCNFVYNAKRWGPHFSHADRHSGDRPQLNWSKFYWKPGPFTDPTYWLLLAASANDLPGYPSIWLNQVTAPGFVTDSGDPWSSGITYRKGGKSDYRRASPHAAPAVWENSTSLTARDFILDHGADRFVINPATGALMDCRDAVSLRTEADARNGTGLDRGLDVSDLWNGPYGFDQDLPSGGITVSQFFSDYYNPWATSHGFPTGLEGFESVHSATGLYYHDLYEAALTPLYTSLGSGTPPVVTPDPEPDFRLTVSDNDHYLNEAFLLGDTAWHLHKYTPNQRQAYFDSRVAQEFNLILGSTLVLDEPDFAGNNNPTASMSDSAWYQNMDDMMQEAEDRGLWYYIPVTWGGYAFKTTTVFASTTAAQTFGAWVANRFKHHKNLIWSPVNEWPEGDTSDPSDRIPYIDAIAAGIKSVISDAIITEHGVGQSFSLSSTQDWFGDESWLTFNGIQTGPNFDYGYKRVKADFDASPTKPTMLLEGGYENSSKAGPLVITQRRQLWHALMSGAVGYGYGNEYLWQKKSGWQDHLADAGSSQMQYALAFLAELPDPLTRTPDQGIFTNTNNEDDYTIRRSTMRDSGKSWLAAYLPNGGSITLKLTTSYLTGSSYTARWFNPSSGTFSNAGSGSLPAANQSFTAPTGTDVVLLVMAS